jgi:glycerol-3-phosphate acyltransferase PlsY
MSLGIGLALIVGYALGSIPVALAVAELHDVDIYTVGDGNPGAWNALDALGVRRAWPVFAGDALKGLLAGLVGLVLGGVSVAYVAVAAAMLGHCFPMFADFKGGKGVMTFAGGAFALAPGAAFICLVVCLLVWFVTRNVKLGASLGVLGFPLVQLALVPRGQVIATGALMSIIGLRLLHARRRDRRAAAGSAPVGPRRA